jgi:hypothetical protein
MRNSPPALIAGLLLSAALTVARAAEPVATLVSFEGEIAVTAPSGTLAAKALLPLPGGTQVKTSPGASAILLLSNGTKFKVLETSTFIVEEPGVKGPITTLLLGELDCWAKKFTNGLRLRVRVPGAVASVRGTVFHAHAGVKESRIDLYKGEIGVTDTFGRSTILSAGQRANITNDYGLTGSSSLPLGAKAPDEPAGPAAPKAPEAKKDEAPKKTVVVVEPPAETPYTTPSQSLPPPPSPLQEVSPSAP